MERPRMLLLSLLVTSVTSSQIDCFLDNQECEATADTLIKVFLDINTAEECLTLCSDDNQCSAFTHFGSTSEPFSLACFLYSSCRSRVPCSSCTTGSIQDDCTCSFSYSGTVGSTNTVGILGSVSDELACKRECSAHEDCAIYTFYDSEDPTNHNLCILLSSTGLEDPVSTCDHCSTGPATCRTGHQCQVAVFLKDGAAMKGPPLSIFANESMSLIFQAREKDCYANISILAIGGGGGYSYGEGGGSGYVETGAGVLKTEEQVVVTVGGAGERSSVVAATLQVEAQQGGDGGSSGGSGYSGEKSSTWRGYHCVQVVVARALRAWGSLEAGRTEGTVVTGTTGRGDSGAGGT